MREEQLFIGGTEGRIASCAFSGHRTLAEDFDRETLKREISSCVRRGARVFYCGMAVGFDLCAGECVLEMKKECPSLRLVACIPCADQEKFFSPADKERYARILDACEVRIVLSGEYYRGCMLKRNEYMAERADALIAYCRKASGGTAYTVKCFEERKKPVFKI